MADHIRWLADLDGSMADAAGGKGASLGELVRAGLPVPNGFVVTRSAFDRFMAEADPEGEVAELIAAVASGRLGVDVGAGRIVARLGTGGVPKGIAENIAAAVEELGAARVSVRSSATCEDGAASAWAGQLDTFLDIGPADVLDRVVGCWLSIFGQPALAYGAAQGYGAGEFSVAVVVQEMVASEVSGIGFSVHPVTQEAGVRLIEACFGLGEAIVSGQIAPDQYIVERGVAEIAEQTVGQQAKALYVEAGSTEPQWRDLGPAGAERKLTPEQVLEYAGILDRVEDHYGFPVDTEWAMRDGHFTLLQSRPITTLAAEYRESIVEPSVPWIPVVRRPMPLVEASILAHWCDVQHSGRDLGFQAEEFMTIQGADDIANHFVSETAFDSGLAFLADLPSTDRERLLSLLDRAHAVYEEGLALVEGGDRPFRDLDEATEYFIRLGEYTTTLPAWILIGFERHGVTDREIEERAMALRSRSLYPYVERHIVEPFVRAAAERIGFSEPEHAGQVVTWTELRRGTLDRATLEERWEEVRAGRRFVYQLLGDEERLRFVSETGYLLMRLAGQRQIVAPDDPDLIAGQAAWPGTVRGRARLVLSSTADDVSIEDGEVLVSIQSSPALMPLLRHAAAIVTDDGGVACHAAIICRELQIPTLIGTGRATATIRTGDLVEVDATAQVVRILERA